LLNQLKTEPPCSGWLRTICYFSY